MSDDANDWWERAIETNRAALLRIVAVLFGMAGLDAGGADVVPRRVWRRIVRLLRPAEAAARRLIVVAARNIEVAPPKPRPEREPTAIERLRAAGVVIHEVNLGLARAWRPEPAAPPKPAPATPAFCLTDPPYRFDKKAWDGLRPFPRDGFELADPDEDVDATRLCRRIQALKRALDDLPGQARRLARWQARREVASRSVQGASEPAAANARSGSAGPPPAFRKPNRKHKRFSPLRLGRPPGYRRRPSRDVDEVLRECHSLARHALDSLSVNHSN